MSLFTYIFRWQGAITVFDKIMVTSVLVKGDKNLN